MPTNFENIEINDAAGLPRKVAGDFETQGPDSIFHQTARNLNTVLEEVTGVTLTSATPTDIALNGMESHVILDIAGVMDNAVKIQLQYTTGGPFYAADWDKLQPLETLSGKRKIYWWPEIEDGWKPTDDEAYNVFSGSHVFAIPTNGAVTCRLQLDGSSVTKAGVAWKRVVLSSPPVVHAITKQKKSYDVASGVVNTADTEYLAGDWLGGPVNLVTEATVPGQPEGIVSLRQLTIAPRTQGAPTYFGDIDVIISTQTLFQTDGAPLTPTAVFGPYILALLQFRQSPGHGQYPLMNVSGFCNVAHVSNINIPLPKTAGPNNDTFATINCIARSDILAAQVGANGFDVGYTIDFG